MKCHTPLGIAVASLLLCSSAAAWASDFYVSPSGNDANGGSLAAPFASLSKANAAASAGDTVWVRGGTYYLTSQLVLSRSGNSDTERTKIWAYPSETPVLDASKYVTSNPAADVPVVLVTGSWMHIKGLEIANAKVGSSGDHSYSLLRTKNASNNTFELLNLHHGFGPGLFIDTGSGGNLILDCDSHDNYDKDGSQGDGQNGDGFGVHYQKTGPSTIMRGCRAWMNSDDGYDLISQEVPVTIENSWAAQNGYANGGAINPSSGNGNGFKVGSSKTGVRHVVQNCVAWKNKAAGFYANHSSGGNTWLNNTAYGNGTQFNMVASPAGDTSTSITLTGSLVHRMKNNIGFPDKNANMGGVDSSFNTWDLDITETSADFASTSDTGATGPRKANGDLPDIQFLKLKAASPLIDKGTPVGLAFAGSAPDLGAYEFGVTNTGGAGGSEGPGRDAGADGAGGAAGTTDRDASVDNAVASGGAHAVDAAVTTATATDSSSTRTEPATSDTTTSLASKTATDSETSTNGATSTANGAAPNSGAGCSCHVGRQECGSCAWIFFALALLVRLRRR